jgi:hypothetical protein
MKHILLTVISLLAVWSCNRYDDTAIWDKLDEHTERLIRLEELCDEMNSNISALESIVKALQKNDYITDVSSIMDGENVTGYTITFSESGCVTIYHGKDGSDGENGKNGSDGKDGMDGKDGHSPVIGVRLWVDGIYYWTLDGEWLRNGDGLMLPTTGKDGQNGSDGKDGQDGTDGEDGQDGQDGQPGEDGTDGITPLLKIEDDYWYISYDNGANWERLYKAVGEDGKNGKDGEDGEDGENRRSFFQSVDVSDPDILVLILSDGTRITIPTWKSFDELQAQANALNTNISALQVIAEAVESKDYVTGIAVVSENGIETGYTIHFAKMQPITILYGKDGADGNDGNDGVDGEDGNDGKDAHTPIIGIRKWSDNGYDWGIDSSWDGEAGTPDYYWTIDGEWLQDEEGRYIPATGKNGITPIMKIGNGYWLISIDGGKTWKTEGPATGTTDESIFADITYDSEFLSITLTSGESIVFSREAEKLSLSCDAGLEAITDNSATFSGHLGVPADDLPYSKVTLYYSDAATFSVFTAKSISTSEFDYNQNFRITVTDLNPETIYNYCICASGKHDDMFGEVKTFRTKAYEAEDEYSKNGILLATVENYTMTGYVRPTGVIVETNSTTYYRTDYIDISRSDLIEIAVYARPLSTSVSPIVFFDSEKKYISGLTPEMIKDIYTTNTVSYYETYYKMAIPSNAHYVMSSTSMPANKENLKMYGLIEKPEDKLGFKDSGSLTLTSAFTDKAWASADVLVPGGIYECTVTAGYTGKLGVYIGDSRYSGSGKVEIGSTAVREGEKVTFTIRVPHICKTKNNLPYYPDKCYFRSFQDSIVSLDYSITKTGQDDNPLEGSTQFAHPMSDLYPQRVFGFEAGKAYEYSLTTNYSGSLTLYETYSCASLSSGSENVGNGTTIDVTAGVPVRGIITLSQTESTGYETAGRMPDALILRSHLTDDVTIDYNFVEL